MQPSFPSPDDNDTEDVAWGLTTGAALWKQGETYDAIVWLKRAVASAAEAGEALRADELNRAATDLLASLAAAAPALGDSTPPPPPDPVLESPTPAQPFESSPAFLLDSLPDDLELSPQDFDSVPELEALPEGPAPPAPPPVALPPPRMPPHLGARAPGVLSARPASPVPQHAQEAAFFHGEASQPVAPQSLPGAHHPPLPPLPGPPPPPRRSSSNPARRESRPIPPLPGTPSIDRRSSRPQRVQTPVRNPLVTEVDEEEEVDEQETIPLPLLSPFSAGAPREHSDPIAFADDERMTGAVDRAPSSRPSSVPSSRSSPVSSSRPNPVPASRSTSVPPSFPASVPPSRPSPLPASRPSPVPASRPSPLPGSRPSPVPSARATYVSSSPPVGARPSPAPPRSTSVAPPISLDALGSLTQEQREALLRTATIESLDAEEEVTVAGLAVVITGQAAIQATVADTSAGVLGAGELLYAKSPIPETLSLRLVAEADQTQVALWDLKTADDALSSSPALLGELRQASARIQAVAGCTMGPIGERLDDALRALAIERLETRILEPNEILAAAGLPVPGMVIVGVGTVELEQENGGHGRLLPGDFLFATEVLGAEPAPATARAGAKGAIVLFGARALAHELLVTCPPLLEIFAGM